MSTIQPAKSYSNKDLQQLVMKARCSQFTTPNNVILAPRAVALGELCVELANALDHVMKNNMRICFDTAAQQQMFDDKFGE